MKGYKKAQRLTLGMLTLGLAVTTTAGVLHAQPVENNQPQQDGQRGGRGGRGGGQGGQGGGFNNMTPEQREAAARQRREENIRRQLNDAGYNEKDVQDAIVEFANAQAQDEAASQEKVRALSQAIRNGADADIAALLAQLRAEIAAAKTQREAALAKLDEKIGYSRSPRLEAILVVSGLTGEVEGNPGGRGGGFSQGGQGGGQRGGGRGGRGGGQGGGQGNQ